jgi:UDP-2-acetamido-3-amino-2,3-dideoxy-glucuronate N-acetyltransferase
VRAGRPEAGTTRGDVALGVVGAGRWGSRYLTTLAAVEGVRVALVVSRNPATRERVPAGCEVVADWRAALGSRDLDGIILATPPALHHEMAAGCVAAGMPVLVEKPLTLDAPSARSLRDAAHRRESLVMVDHTHVFSAAFVEMKARSRRLAPPLRIRSLGGNRGPFREDVDGLWDYGPHDVSMCLDLVGEVPVAVDARRAPAGGGGDPRSLAVDARLEFPRGAVAELTFGNALAEKRRVFEVRGDDGILRYDDLAPDKLVEIDPRGEVRALSVSPVPPLARVALAFRDAIAAGERRHPSLALGVAVVEVLERIASALDATAATALR